jgi:hypothetical protein
MSSSNYIFRNDNEETLKRVRDEFIDYVGREAEITGPGELTVYALPQQKRREKEKADAEKRAERAERAQRFSKRERTDGIIPR